MNKHHKNYKRFKPYKKCKLSEIVVIFISNILVDKIYLTASTLFFSTARWSDV